MSRHQLPTWRWKEPSISRRRRGRRGAATRSRGSDAGRPCRVAATGASARRGRPPRRADRDRSRRRTGRLPRCRRGRASNWWPWRSLRICGFVRISRSAVVSPCWTQAPEPDRRRRLRSRSAVSSARARSEPADPLRARSQPPRRRAGGSGGTRNPSSGSIRSPFGVITWMVSSPVQRKPGLARGGEVGQRGVGATVEGAQPQSLVVGERRVLERHDSEAGLCQRPYRISWSIWPCVQPRSRSWRRVTTRSCRTQLGDVRQPRQPDSSAV